MDVNANQKERHVNKTHSHIKLTQQNTPDLTILPLTAALRRSRHFDATRTSHATRNRKRDTQAKQNKFTQHTWSDDSAADSSITK
jgi:hypothetical protein